MTAVSTAGIGSPETHYLCVEDFGGKAGTAEDPTQSKGEAEASGYARIKTSRFKRYL